MVRNFSRTVDNTFGKTYAVVKSRSLLISDDLQDIKSENFGTGGGKVRGLFGDFQQSCNLDWLKSLVFRVSLQTEARNAVCSKAIQVVKCKSKIVGISAVPANLF